MSGLLAGGAGRAQRGVSGIGDGPRAGNGLHDTPPSSEVSDVKGFHGEVCTLAFEVDMNPEDAKTELEALIDSLLFVGQALLNCREEQISVSLISGAGEIVIEIVGKARMIKTALYDNG